MEREKEQHDPCQVSGVSIVSSFNSAVSFVPFKARPLSCSAAITSSSSTPTTTTTTSTQPRPLSCSSVTSSSLAAKTLVQPRRWRFLHKSKMGNTQASQEDVTLEGDSDLEEEEDEDTVEEDTVDEDSASDKGSSVDAPDTSVESDTRKDAAQETVKQNGDHEVSESIDTAKHTRKRSSSDVAKEIGAIIEFRAKQSGSIAASRPSQFPEPVVRPILSTFSEKTPNYAYRDRSDRRSTLPGARQARLPVEPKVVKFMDLETPRRPKSEGSPDKRIVLNAQEHAVKFLLSEPNTIQSPETPSPTNQNPFSPPDFDPFSRISPHSRFSGFPVAKPPVPDKPTLTRSKSDPTEAPRRDPLSSPSSPAENLKKSSKRDPFQSCTSPVDNPKESPKRDSLPSSPVSPMEDVLFSLGYTRVEGAKGAAKTKDTISPDKVVNKASPITNPDKTIVDKQPDSATPPAKPDTKTVAEKTLVETPVPQSKPEIRPVPHVIEVIEIPRPSKQEAPSEIKPKPMKKVKGDSAPEEKQMKKMKVNSEEEEKPKEHVKLFPWKVEFSTKAKASSGDDSDDTWRKGDSKGYMVSSEAKVKEDSLPRNASKKDSKSKKDSSGGEHKKHRGFLSFMRDKTDKHKHEATTKKSDKTDGAKSPPDKKPALSPDRPQQPLPEAQQQEQQRSPKPEPVQEEEPREQGQEDSQAQPHPEEQTQSEQEEEQQQQQQQVQLQHAPPHHQPLVPPPKPPHLEDISSSDTQNSDVDSLYGSMYRKYVLPLHQEQISESDGEITPQSTMRRPPPRRHTVGGAQMQRQLEDETERKREAFYELLAQRYPQYADKITGMSAHPGHGPPLPTAAERIRTDAEHIGMLKLFESPEAAVGHAVGMAQRSLQDSTKNPRPREPQRRRTTAVVYAPPGRVLDYEDPGTMSDIELSSFQRGSYARASLPIVRSASSSLERPIGLVFLVYRDETKKALLPNEITTLDTVRALFVRAFPEKLSMEYLDSPKRKIYILEAATNIFFQLEDLRDIKDRTVLKIHECDSTEPQKVRCPPEVRGRTVQQHAAPSSRPSSRQGFPGEAMYGEITKTQSLPVSSAQNYQELMAKERLQWEMEQNYMQQQSRRSRSRSLTPEPAGAERPRSLSTGAPRTRFSHSPDRMTPDRAAHLGPIPENPRLLANGFREAMVNGGGGHYDSLPHHSMASPTSHHPPGQPGRVLSPTPAQGPIYESVYATYAHPQAYVSHSKWAQPQQGPQRATGPPSDMRGRREMSPANRHSLTFAAMSGPGYDAYPQRSQSYRATPERDVMPPRPSSTTPQDPETRDRMERMEAQIASLAAWVHQCQVSPTPDPTVSAGVRRGPGSSRSTSSTHSEGTDTYPGSSASNSFRDSAISTVAGTNTLNQKGLSDIPTATYSVHQPVVTGEMRHKIAYVQQRLRELRRELQGIRRMEQHNQEVIRESFSETLWKIKCVMGSVPGAEEQVVRHQRAEVNVLLQAYREDKERIEKELSDLEQSVEELREDVVARRCRVSVSDVEGFALLLSNITKSLADLKGRFPQINESLKSVMAGEMEIVVKEEKFIKEEPLKLEASLKRCKRLTSTLYTLKRLASVQDTRPLHVPSLAQETKDVGEGEKMAILESIRAMVPDHETRVQSMEAADASRERKKKIVTQQESLKFTKSLQTASKALKHADGKTDTADGAQKGETEPRRGSTSGSEGRIKSPPPEIPAKPARLLSSSEAKKSDSSASSTTHTVTVTSQMADDGDKAPKMTEQLATQRSAARQAFFSSLSSPDTSPTSTQPENSKASKSSVSSSASSSRSALPSSLGSIPISTGKPSGGVYFQAVSPTRVRSAFSSIPQPSKPLHTVSPGADRDDEGDGSKPKKVPPPPPPRKSSAKLYGLSAGAVNGGSSGKGDKSPGGRDKKGSSPTSPAPSGIGPLSSTPKPATPAKPMNKFQKDIAAGIYANMNRPDLQHQKVAPEHIITSMASPPPAAVTTNSQDPQVADDQDLSGSESTGSSTSLDSQIGVGLLRSSSSAGDAGRKGRPEPPQRHSSLSGKPDDSTPKTKTQMLQERSKKLQEGGDRSGGSKVSQVNGLTGGKDGHKT